jgi:hypothetical protein
LGNSVALVPENLDHLGDPPNILRLILILRQSQIWNSKKRTKKDVGIDGIDCTRPRSHTWECRWNYVKLIIWGSNAGGWLEKDCLRLNRLNISTLWKFHIAMENQN